MKKNNKDKTNISKWKGGDTHVADTDEDVKRVCGTKELTPVSVCLMLLSVRISRCVVHVWKENSASNSLDFTHRSWKRLVFKLLKEEVLYYL